MLRSTQQDKYFQVIEWTLYFGLCGVSAIFMNGVLEKYLSRKTSFTPNFEMQYKSSEQNKTEHLPET